MQKWEYWMDFVWPNRESERGHAGGRIPAIREYMEAKYPNNKRTYSPRLVEAWLNTVAKEGWELVRMEPVSEVGDSHDWKSADVGESRGVAPWIRCYFVVLRRLVDDPAG